PVRPADACARASSLEHSWFQHAANCNAPAHTQQAEPSQGNREKSKRNFLALHCSLFTETTLVLSISKPQESWPVCRTSAFRHGIRGLRAIPLRRSRKGLSESRGQF